MSTDNIAITAGAGTSVATDNISGVHHQKVKVTLGSTGVANNWSVGSGAIDTGTPRMALATDSPGVLSTGTRGVPSATYISTQEAYTNTGTLSSISATTTAQTVLAANTARLGATIFNDSSAACYLGLSSTTPSTAAFTVKLAASDYYEIPAKYTGIIKGVWTSAAGTAQVTELT